MASKTAKLTILAAVLLGGVGLGMAATSNDDMHQHMMDRGMVETCRSMMGGGMMGAMMGNSMMPTLPPGNAKLQLQMQAEMLQKMGEIAAKYAARVQERSSP